MAKTDQKGVLSFQQDAGFYMRAARKAMDGGELIQNARTSSAWAEPGWLKSH